MSGKEHDRLLAAAAKTALAPLGCKRKGRSRTWLDDQGWWVGVVEFQPSGWSKGSYLNVGACWLWVAKDHYSFDDGSRVEGFRPFRNAADFAPHATALADRAAVEVGAVRARCASIAAVATRLDERTEPGTAWDAYHAGIANGLAGRTKIAASRLAAVSDIPSHAPWVDEVKANARAYLECVQNPAAFRARIAITIAEARRMLKLPAIEGEWFGD